MIALAALLTGIACAGQLDPVLPSVEIEVGGESLTVWVADESAERRQGLMDLSELPDRVDGMLFVFPNATTAGFTMRDTLIPLDIWWFGPDMTLIGSSEMEPCPAAPCASYASPGEIAFALETPQGMRDFSPGVPLVIVEND